MKPKVLIFGCSFSAGRYSCTEQNTEQVHTDVGWYDQLSKDYNYTIYSFHGGGAVNYAHTLLSLHKQNALSEYEHCIIQQTWEPRFTLYQNEGFEEPVVVDNRTLYSTYGCQEKLFRRELDNPILDFFLEHRGNEYQTKFEKEHKKYLSDIGNNKHLIDTIYSSYALINNLLLQSNVKGCTFSLFPKFDSAWAMPAVKQLDWNYSKFLDLVSSTLENTNNIVKHLDIDNTKKLGNLVSHAFDKYLHDV